MQEESRFENVLKSLRVRKGKVWGQEKTAELLGVSVRTYKGWENGERLPSPEYLKAIVVTFGLGQDDEVILYRAAARTPPKMHNLPLPQNPFFTGRAAYIEDLRRLFSSSRPPNQSVSISGMGGIGKTQLALEYAYRCYQQDIYRAVFWIDASENATQSASIKSIERVLDNYPSPVKVQHNLISTSGAVSIVGMWLQEHTDWLLIIDNIDYVQSGQFFSLWLAMGHVLLTSNAQAVRGSGVGAQLRLKEFEQEEGISFLLRRAGLPHTQDVNDKALWLVQELGGHALALDQVAAYIEESGISLVDYIELYKQECQALLGTYGVSGETQSSHPETVVSTISLSLKKVQSLNKQASSILYFCSFLLPDNIPEEVLHRDVELHPDSRAFNAAISALRRYSLIERNAANRTYSIHRLVHTVVSESMPHELKYRWIRRVVHVLRLICDAHPEPLLGESRILWLVENGNHMFSKAYPYEYMDYSSIEALEQDRKDFGHDCWVYNDWRERHWSYY